jgi:hypothetical protein
MEARNVIMIWELASATLIADGQVVTERLAVGKARRQC